MSNAQKQKEEFSTLESIFGKEVVHVEKQSGKGSKDREKILKFKLTDTDVLSLLIPPGYPSESMPVILKSGKGSKNLTSGVYDEITSKLQEIFEVHTEAGLYELFQWFIIIIYYLTLLYNYS